MCGERIRRTETSRHFGEVAQCRLSWTPRSEHALSRCRNQEADVEVAVFRTAAAVVHDIDDQRICVGLQVGNLACELLSIHLQRRSAESGNAQHADPQSACLERTREKRSDWKSL